HVRPFFFAFPRSDPQQTTCDRQALVGVRNLARPVVQAGIQRSHASAGPPRNAATGLLDIRIRGMAPCRRSGPRLLAQDARGGGAMNDNAGLHVNRARQGPVLDHLIVSDREGGYAGDVRSGGVTELASWNRTADILVNALRTAHSRTSAERCKVGGNPR